MITKQLRIQGARIGNSVCPRLAAAINVTDEGVTLREFEDPVFNEAMKGT